MAQFTGKKLALLVVGVFLLLCLVAYLFVNYGNPQWHWRLYAHQARNTENSLLDPSGSYSGEWRNWDETGRLLSVFNYKNGKRDGPYTTFTEDNDILSRGQYKGGELDGVQTVTQEGTRTEIPYNLGKRNGNEKTWYANGQLAVDAPWVDGLQDGVVTFYYENGSVQSTIPFYKGNREGPMKTWFEDGVLQAEENFTNNQKNGTSTFWGHDGSVDMELHYRYDEMDGVQTWYYPDGKKSREIHMVFGVPNGEWKEWDESGELITDDYYEKGEMKQKPATPGGSRNPAIPK